MAFSCKRRGICPSCGTRRMAEAAAHLVDHVIPKVPVCRWVLSFPIPLRRLFAVYPDLLARHLARGGESFALCANALGPSTSSGQASACMQGCVARPRTSRGWNNCAATLPARRLRTID